MAMSATAIRFDDGEKDWIQSYASVLGMSFSEFVRNAALDKVEEEADIKAYNEALMEDDDTRYSMNDVMRIAHIICFDGDGVWIEIAFRKQAL